LFHDINEKFEYRISKFETNPKFKTRAKFKIFGTSLVYPPVGNFDHLNLFRPALRRIRAADFAIDHLFDAISNRDA